ncbi:helix-turn-helix domain-containing protein, partial [Streptomyces sp. NRRL B-24484]|uniref:helix-turn-helix domain-containing protein n=1 Tax=Streptomyces sp. NRRL B-24484 TaxID=1463833 RepID=UPI0004BFFB42
MGREHDEREAALTELRKQLADALARKGLTKTQLAKQAGLGRTTVQEAFQAGGPVPSPATVAALAGKLGLPADPLLQLQRRADGDEEHVGAAEVGKPIGQWDPHDLEVHPAATAPAAIVGDARPLRATVLSGYVPRAHDRVLGEAVREAAEGESRMLVLVGSSSTGKTRACWEAVQPLAALGWRLWHPHDPGRAEAALAAFDRVAPRTVVWLNEAQHYLGHPQDGERIAAALRSLLADPECRPLLVLGTLWPEYVDTYTALPRPGEPDRHSRVRELLSGHTLTVPDTFDQEALLAATALARDGDRLLADALTRARTHGRLTQDLAGAPELLRRYEHGTPAVRALLEAAMDARRLGVQLHLPQAFLTDAAADYLTDHDWDQLTDDWAEAAYADLARPVHGKQAPLRRTNARPPRRPPGIPAPVTMPPAPAAGPVFRIADYLEQHGRTTRRRLCPPASFWHAAHTHLTHPDDLGSLTIAADERHRLQWAHHLRLRAAAAGSTTALTALAQIRAKEGDQEGAEKLYQQAADVGTVAALNTLAHMREKAGDWKGAEALHRQAADADNDSAILSTLAYMRGRAGDWKGAEDLAQQVAAAGDPDALGTLAKMRDRAGDWKGAEHLYRQAADAGYPVALCALAKMRQRTGDREGAEKLYQQAADVGTVAALRALAYMRERAGDRESAEDLARQAADAGYPAALSYLAYMRERAGDRTSAENLYREAATAGHTSALQELAVLRENAGDREGAEDLARQAATVGNISALHGLAVLRERAGDPESAEILYWEAATAGHTSALQELAVLRENAGDREGAEDLARRAADAGHTDALSTLAEMRERTGDAEAAESLARQAAAAGDRTALSNLAAQRAKAGDLESADNLYRQAADAGWPRNLSEHWPFGLDPDGSPTPAWR